VAINFSKYIEERENRRECTFKQEGHDGPEVAHLYIGPQNEASLKTPGLLFEQNW
jgi:hypothetical protein